GRGGGGGRHGADTCGRSPSHSRHRRLGSLRPGPRRARRASAGSSRYGEIMSNPTPPAGPPASSDVEGLRTRLEKLLPQAISDLEDLVRIPSIAFEGYDTEPVRSSAEAVASLLREAGMGEVSIEYVAGGGPAVIGRTPAREGRPDVVLYG